MSVARKSAANPFDELHERLDDLGRRLEQLAAGASRPQYTTPRNAESLFSRKWRGLDEWAQRHGLARYRIGGGPKDRGTPSYLTADLDALVRSTAVSHTLANGVDLDDDYTAIAGGIR